MAISPFFTKAALGMGAASVTAAGAAYAGGVFSPSEEKGELISKLIKTVNPDKRAITATAGTDANWKEAWKRYREDNREKNPKEDVWKLESWVKPTSSSITNAEEAPAYFRSACTSRLSQKVSDVKSSLYKEVLEYCTRDTLVEDWVKDSGKSLREKGDGSSSEWKALWTKYREANKNKNSGQDEWKISKQQWTSVTEESAPEEFRNKCETESKLKAGKSSEDSVKRVLAYCI
ncbi:hypothetical protein MHF_0334 [Mycoplasma haemofelis Ohio2]|uniref:Lipoprotein n=1 Tax=Mycoplasma haemofelis (strain Ohio2) TaxID=859194 RepID=F6FGU0_MYCHI|nr:hypothetical protein MHF_0334 [Mycoplasma haemofelis Ohio2]